MQRSSPSTSCGASFQSTRVWALYRLGHAGIVKPKVKPKGVFAFFFASFDCGSWVKDCNAVLHPCHSMSQPGYPQLTEIYLHMALLQPFDRKLCLECSEKEKHFVKQENFGWNLKTESGSATSKGSLMRYESYERTKVQFWVHDEIRPDFQLEAKVQTFPISCHLLACLDLIFWPGTPLNL